MLSWRAIMKGHYEGPLWRAITNESYEGPLWRAIMNESYEGPLWRAIMNESYEGPLWRAIMNCSPSTQNYRSLLQNIVSFIGLFGMLLWSAIINCSYLRHLPWWGVILKSRACCVPWRRPCEWVTSHVITYIQYTQYARHSVEASILCENTCHYQVPCVLHHVTSPIWIGHVTHHHIRTIRAHHWVTSRARMSQRPWSTVRVASRDVAHVNVSRHTSSHMTDAAMKRRACWVMSHMNMSHHTHQEAALHIPMSHITHECDRKAPRVLHHVTSPMWMSHVTHHDTYQMLPRRPPVSNHVTSPLWMNHVTSPMRMNHVTPHVRKRHIPHINESCQTSIWL